MRLIAFKNIRQKSIISYQFNRMSQTFKQNAFHESALRFNQQWIRVGQRSHINLIQIWRFVCMRKMQFTAKQTTVPALKSLSLAKVSKKSGDRKHRSANVCCRGEFNFTQRLSGKYRNSILSCKSNGCDHCQRFGLMLRWSRAFPFCAWQALGCTTM